MLLFTKLRCWQIWSALWGRVSWLVSIFKFQFLSHLPAKEVLNEDVEQGSNNSNGNVQQAIESPPEDIRRVFMPAPDEPPSLHPGSYPITWGDNSMPLVGTGRFGCVFKYTEDRVLKRPKTYPEVDDPDVAYINEANIDCLKHEADVYERLGRHKGIVQYFGHSNYSIELAHANQGDLFAYMQRHPPPTEETRLQWIQSLTDVFAYAHSRRVVIEDINLKNILVHNGCLQLVDFGNAFLLPMDTDMATFQVQDITPEAEIVHVGCVFYSIATWNEFKYDYFSHSCLPKLDQIPDTNGILGETIISKCWSGGYNSMGLLRKDVKALLG